MGLPPFPASDTDDCARLSYQLRPIPWSGVVGWPPHFPFVTLNLLSWHGINQKLMILLNALIVPSSLNTSPAE
jgi:hypothetical protein